MKTQRRARYDSFAHLLDYPDSQNRLSTARALAIQLYHNGFDQAAIRIEKSIQTLEPLTLDQHQELYTTTFDFNQSICLYAGYLLFGESYKRGALLVQLRQAYEKVKLDEPQGELADYMPTIIRFIGKTPHSDSESIDMARYLLLPALMTALQAFRSREDTPSSPYTLILEALKLVLTTEFGEPAFVPQKSPPCSTCSAQEEQS